MQKVLLIDTRCFQSECLCLSWQAECQLRAWRDV